MQEACRSFVVLESKQAHLMCPRAQFDCHFLRLEWLSALRQQDACAVIFCCRPRRWSVPIWTEARRGEKILYREKDVETQFTQALTEARRLFSSVETSSYSEKKPGKDRQWEIDNTPTARKPQSKYVCFVGNLIRLRYVHCKGKNASYSILERRRTGRNLLASEKRRHAIVPYEES
ncbi:MAG: hypothetical protein AUH89_04215 [Ktedonobacter sp. 13_1_40CM_4_52_4]|nr:MAG: hypothetical protein AUH89_04215 [Ktedonobacter sp. 13_1_40CM_4_52_4]